MYVIYELFSCVYRHYHELQFSLLVVTKQLPSLSCMPLLLMYRHYRTPQFYHELQFSLLVYSKKSQAFLPSPMPIYCIVVWE